MSTKNKIIIRPARPEDAAAAMPLIISSGPDVFAYLFNRLGKSAEDFVLHSLQSNKGLFGYQAHTVAELDGQVVGAGSFYSRKEYKQWSNQMTPLLAKHYRWRLPFMLDRLLKSTQWMVAPAYDEWYLANFGVSPEWRGHGIGEQMLQYGLQQAQNQNKRIYSLDVSHANPNAERLYRRFGMDEVNNQVFPGAKGRVADCRRLQMVVPS